jgi:hypothetical protein
MNSEINNLIYSIESSTKKARETFSGLSEAQLNWKPSPEKWSVGECIDHLIVSNKQYFPALEKITKGGHKNSLWQSLSPLSGLWGSFLIKAVSPDNVKKVKTAKVFYPSSSMIHKNIIDEFAACNLKVTELMRKLENYDLKKIKISSPVSAFITYSLIDTLKIITYHEARHINQAERVIATEGFPKE